MSRRAHVQIDLFDSLPEATRPPSPPDPFAAGADIGEQADASVDPVDPVDHWAGRIADAFDAGASDGGYLTIAEEALKACPGETSILILAATATLFDHKAERALVLLKRFHKRADWPGEHLLRAIALNISGQRYAARLLLERHGLTDLLGAYRYFPGGRSQVPFLMRQLDEIMERESRWPARRKTSAADGGRSAKPAKPARRAEPKPVHEPASRKAGGKHDVEPCPAPQVAPLPLADIANPIRIACDLTQLEDALAGAPDPGGRFFALRQRLDHLALAQGFDELLCLPRLTGVEPLWHQIETVRKVPKKFRGRVLLADEVGLGKTIEAGMVLREFALRGMAGRALVLTPASLVGQWREELSSKLGLDFATTHDALLREDASRFWDEPRIIASIATARRREHAEPLAARKLDIVVVDEANHLRDRGSAGWKLVDALNKRFLLLLSATRVQNDLVELCNLLTLLKPGIFETLQEFKSAYMTPGKPREPAKADRLRELLRGAMMHNTRAVVALKLPRRHASTIRIDPAPGEAEAYAALAEAARMLAADGGGRQRLQLHHLLAAAGSSPAATARAADRAAERRSDAERWQDAARRFATVAIGGKEAALLDLLAKNRSEKKLLFVQARETVHHLAKGLAAAGMDLERFDGSMTGPGKDAAIEAFRERATVLLCTQSGGEGRNIQFCNTLINYDVPWNPMAVEQRIGRIDRIGQTREVFAFNLVTRGTIEEKVLDLLEEKISMFELVVGEVGVILGHVEEEREFPDLVLVAWLETSESRRAAAYEALGERLDAARRQHVGAKELDEALFGEDFGTTRDDRHVRAVQLRRRPPRERRIGRGAG